MPEYENVTVQWDVEQICRGKVCVVCGYHFGFGEGKLAAICIHCVREGKRLNIIMGKYRPHERKHLLADECERKLND